MKQRTLLAFSAIFFLPLLAVAGHQVSSTTPTLEVSCNPCAVGEPIIFAGSGYKSRAQVELDVQGPCPYVMVTEVDTHGNIYVDYGTTLTFDSGSYSVTALAMSGKSLTPMATQTFTVE